MAAAWLFVLAVFAAAARLWWCLRPSRAAPRDKPARTLLVLGSGGHTAEILSFFAPCDSARFVPRRYVVAATDPSSEAKARRAEEARGAAPDRDFSFAVVPRAREVRQSYVTSVATTLRAAWSSLLVVWRFAPDVVVCNGPGTCLPIAVAAVGLHVVGLRPRCRVVFVESFCRVTTLSLTGRLLYPVASLFVVQWPGLAEKYPRAQYLGRIC